MSIRALDERHKRLAEMILLGKPETMTKRAEVLGVNKATLYTWMQDALWRGYFEKLVDNVEAARVARLLPLVLRGADAVESSLAAAIKLLNSDDDATRQTAPKLETLVRALKVLVELERVDRGQPGTITRKEQKKTSELATGDRAKGLLELLDKVVLTEQTIGGKEVVVVEVPTVEGEDAEH